MPAAKSARGGKPVDLPGGLGVQFYDRLTHFLFVAAQKMVDLVLSFSYQSDWKRGRAGVSQFVILIMSPDGSSKKNDALPTGSPAGLLQECLACGVIVVGARERIVACTAEAAAHFAREGGAVEKCLHQFIARATAGINPRRGQKRQGLTNREIEIKNPRGGATTLRAKILPVKPRAAAQVVVVLNNLASAPLVELNMRRLDRLSNLGLLSASMAHEIKNGMVAIKTFVDLLAQKNQEAELTEVVGRELQRINAIVTQMLRFAAPKPATFATVHIHDLLDYSLRLLQHQIGVKMISLQRNFRPRRTRCAATTRNCSRCS